MPRRNAPRTPPLPPRWVSLARAVHPFPALLVAVVTTTIAFLAVDGPPAGTVAALAMGMLCFQFAIGLANDVVDAAEDARSKPWKAIPRGVLPRRHAVAGVAGLTGLGLLVTSGLPFGAWLIGLAGLACGLSYDVQFKRTALSWLPLSVAIPLVPAWVYVSLDAWSHALWWVFPLGALLGLSLHLANQLPDVAAGAAARGAAHRIGARRAMAGSLGIYALAAILASAVLFATATVALGALVAFGALFTGSLASRSVAFFGRDGFFGLLATSSAVVGVAFLAGAG
ncbi:MAG: hypothetical protein AMXMBFR80_26450 [Dehalococcoidia bacterium]|nr:UbiA family prenyltransferase [Tepidiformaceae bacterium]